MAISGLDGLSPSSQDRTTEFIRRNPEPPRETPITPESERASAVDRRAQSPRETSEADAERKRQQQREAVTEDPAVTNEEIALDVARREETLSRLREAHSVNIVRQSLLDG